MAVVLQNIEAFPQKNTFIHFDEEACTPVAAPPTFSAPGTLLNKSFRTREPIALEEVVAPEQPLRSRRRDILWRMLGSSQPATAGNQMPAEVMSSPVHVQLKNTFVHFEEPQTPAGPPVHTAPETTVSTVPPPPAPAAEARPRVGMASLGSEGHCTGQCIPCLMQVRWQAGRCAEPCKFGVECGRCHEAHTEEELQKIQAKMRKQKKKHGERAAALLSSAYANGNVAPVGAGAAVARQQ
jgi:hypothetical protein